MMMTEQQIRSRIDEYRNAIQDEERTIASLKQAYEGTDVLDQKVAASVDIKKAESQIDLYGALIDELEKGARMKTVRDVRNRIVKHRQAIETEAYKIERLNLQLARTASLENKVRITDEVKQRQARIERHTRMIDELQTVLGANGSRS